MPSERKLLNEVEAVFADMIESVAHARYWQERYLTEIEREHEQRLTDAAIEYDMASKANERLHEETTKEIAQRLQDKIAKAEKQQERATAAARDKSEKAIAEIRAEYEKSNQGLNEQMQAIVSEAGISVAPYDDSLWVGFKPMPRHGRVSSIARIGQLTEPGPWGPVILPAAPHIIGGSNLLLEISGSAKASATGGLQSLMLRLIASVPPGKLRFTFVDPVGLGQNVAAFMHLADYDDALVTSKAWTEPQHIEHRLSDLTEHMENVIQKYLRNQYASIEEYNIHAGEVQEPYRVLVVFDFPVNFSEAAARRLVSIAANGPRCGVYTLVLMDTKQPLPYGFNLAALEEVATVISWDSDHFMWRDEDFGNCQLEFDSPPATTLFNNVLKAIGEGSKESSKVEVPFERIAPPEQDWWTMSSATGLKAALGPSGARKVQLMELGRGTAQHALVGGKTGSGKSTLLHTLITSLALSYSPEELELYLIDFKQGIEFKTYAERKLPHARVIAIESEREFGLSVLQGLDAEIKRRGELFRAATGQTGQKIENIANYRATTGKKLPRTLLLVDEFQEFFTEDDAIASGASQILDRLVRQGRAFGIHVLLGSQTLAGSYNLARSTIDQMAIRIALQSSEADSRLILADDNPAARLLARPGEAIYNSSNGTVEGNNRFQVAWLPDEQRDLYLDRLLEMVTEKGYRPPREQIVFEGNAPAAVEKNRALSELLVQPAPATPTMSTLAWLGDPIAIREPIAANFRRQSGSNLLIVGQNEKAALGMMSVALASLAAQLPAQLPPNGTEGEGGPPSHTFYVFDFGSGDGAHAGFFNNMSTSVPSILVGNRQVLTDVINALATEVKRRMDTDENSRAPLYLFVYGLHRARDLRPDESGSFGSFSSSFSLNSSFDEPSAPPPPHPSEQFTTILREGPDVGVHTIAWCDTVTNLNRSVDRRALREFAMRVAFQMSAEDSANLVDTPAAAKLGQYRALFYSEDEGRMEKFRPYGVPAPEWLAQVGASLQGRGASHISDKVMPRH